MEQLLVRGGRELCGKLELPKAKNSVLPILAAALLCEGESRICKVPALRDVDTSIQLLRAVGGTVQKDGDMLTVSHNTRLTCTVPKELSGAMRSSVYYMVPLLLHGGAVRMPLPGGCRIGARPIDLHLAGLCAMGVTFTHEGETLRCTAPNGLQGTRFCLSFPSVGATETLMMAASLARGRTVLHGCAREPEVLDLACFLQCCGANIRGAGGDCITIEGVRALHGVRYVPIADRIAAATVLFAVCACGGDVTLCDVRYEHLISVVRTLEAMGAVLERPEQGKLRIRVTKPLRAAAVTTGVYPAFPTDAGPLFAAACLGAEGESSITETIFEHRFACADEFRKLGARLHCEERCLQIHGAAALTGARLYAEDLRGGAALVIAALAANGESRIENAEYIRRGYADIALLFRGLGAAIEQCES